MTGTLCTQACRQHNVDTGQHMQTMKSVHACLSQQARVRQKHTLVNCLHTAKHLLPNSDHRFKAVQQQVSLFISPKLAFPFVQLHIVFDVAEGDPLFRVHLKALRGAAQTDNHPCLEGRSGIIQRFIAAIGRYQRCSSVTTLECAVSGVRSGVQRQLPQSACTIQQTPAVCATDRIGHPQW